VIINRRSTSDWVNLDEWSARALPDISAFCEPEWNHPHSISDTLPALFVAMMRTETGGTLLPLEVKATSRPRLGDAAHVPHRVR
jgi:hypothetical protein